MKYFEKTVRENKIYDGKIISVIVEDVELPEGKESKREIVRHPGGVGVLAFKDENTVLIVEQFRKPFNKFFYEIPAGKLEVNEEPLDCAKRELEEETGYTSSDFSYLGKIAVSPGYSNEYIHMFMAKNLKKGNLCPDEDEYIDVHEISTSNLKEMIQSGEITDSKTICSFLLSGLK